nr:nucleotide-binding alpha-beta plait domain-containing protein [Tanacetum cinerariifolium]
MTDEDALTTLKVVYVLTTLMQELMKDATVEAIRIRAKWENDDYICRGHILNEDSSSKKFLVVDAYIPYRRSKAGKRFGFIRFIKVLDVDRLVNNLCTVWVRRHKLQANIPRFQREPLKRHSSLHNIYGVKKGNSGDTYNGNGVKGAVNSYAHVVKGSQNSKMDSDSSPVMVLDDSCLNEKDYSFCLMGKVKDFATLENLKVVAANERFNNIKFKYMGGYWVRAKEVPGWIPDFAKDNNEEEDSKVGSYEEVPNGEDVKNVEDLEGSKEATGEKQFDSKKNSKNDVKESICSGHFKKSKVPKSSGSILQLIDDLAKVGETMGYDMKGCMKNMEEIIEFFDKFIEDSWKDAPIIESNALVRMMKKLKYLKEKNPRTDVVKLLQEIEKKNYLEAAQKAKIKWATEGDENSKYYHGVINKKRNQLSIRGILVEGTWIDSPSLVKNEIKKAVWDYGIDKSPGPDGFTFGFYRRYWKLNENDVVDAVTCFFHQGSFPKGGNSSFIILIPKTPNANMVKDYGPISLIGSMYKIIS